MKLYLGRYFCIFSADFFENDFAMRPHRAHARMAHGPCPILPHALFWRRKHVCSRGRLYSMTRPNRPLPTSPPPSNTTPLTIGR